MSINKRIKEKIVLALDVDTEQEAKELIKELKDYVGVFKLGLQFYTSNGSSVFKFIKDEGAEVFFDVKLHDIPNTVKKASENIVRKGVGFFNLHATGGAEMMRQAKEGADNVAKELGQKSPTILAVTLLTSISQTVLNEELKINSNTKDYALMLAKLAKNSGMSGVVASAHEAAEIKSACGSDFKVLCPGIRPQWSVANEQKRIATPSYAISQGADYLVIGRAVTASQNKVDAMKKIYDEIESVL